MSNQITCFDDVIDSRDVIARIDELEGDLQARFDTEQEEQRDALKETLEAGYAGYGPNVGADEKNMRSFENWLDDIVNDEGSGLQEQGLAYLDLLDADGEDFDDAWLGGVADGDHDMQAEAEELRTLLSLAAEAGDCGDWKYGATLVRESHFTDYCEELCKDIGDLPKDIPGYLVIDWEATADNLKADYSEVDFAGVDYLIRS